MSFFAVSFSCGSNTKALVSRGDEAYLQNFCHAGCSFTSYRETR